MVDRLSLRVNSGLGEVKQKSTAAAAVTPQPQFYQPVQRM